MANRLWTPSGKLVFATGEMVEAALEILVDATIAKGTESAFPRLAAYAKDQVQELMESQLTNAEEYIKNVVR